MSLEEKQNFLRRKILDGGYDPKKFALFLIEKGGEKASSSRLLVYARFEINSE